MPPYEIPQLCLPYSVPSGMTGLGSGQPGNTSRGKVGGMQSQISSNQFGEVKQL